ncbi:MAG: BON domain-containing protein [Burkholderiales bacterium]|nr:BON domain-containing protein [Opitutaceae bacterium]
MPEWSLTETLRDLIRAAFDSDSRVPSSSIGIAVSAGMIALFGTVPDERAKRAAFELASSIPGAPPVNNRLRVGEDAA